MQSHEKTQGQPVSGPTSQQAPRRAPGTLAPRANLLLSKGNRANLRQHAGGLGAAHDRDAGVGPHEQEVGAVGAPAHAVVARAKAAPQDHGELGDLQGVPRSSALGRDSTESTSRLPLVLQQRVACLPLQLHAHRTSRSNPACKARQASHERGVPCLCIGHGHDHLCAILRNATCLVLLADHEAVDVLQEDQRDPSLRAELDEVRPCSDQRLLFSTAAARFVLTGVV